MAEIFKLFSAEMQQAGQNSPDLIQLLMTKKNKDCQPLFKILLTYPESQPLVSGIKNWVTDYQRLAKSEQDLCQKEYPVINKLYQIIESCQFKQKPKETDQETTEKPTKEEGKFKEEALYLLGGIVILGMLVMIFDRRR